MYNTCPKHDQKECHRLIEAHLSSILRALGRIFRRLTCASLSYSRSYARWSSVVWTCAWSSLVRFQTCCILQGAHMTFCIKTLAFKRARYSSLKSYHPNPRYRMLSANLSVIKNRARKIEISSFKPARVVFGAKEGSGGGAAGGRRVYHRWRDKGCASRSLGPGAQAGIGRRHICHASNKLSTALTHAAYPLAAYGLVLNTNK
eukprot:6178898-Pleurochrysis_carterae.AAC.1